MSCKSLHTSPGRHIPEAQELVFATRQDVAVSDGDAYGSDVTFVSLKDPQALVATDIPKSHALVSACRCDQTAIAADPNILNGRAVADQCSQALRTSQIPELHRIALKR